MMVQHTSQSLATASVHRRSVKEIDFLEKRQPSRERKKERRERNRNKKYHYKFELINEVRRITEKTLYFSLLYVDKIHELTWTPVSSSNSFPRNE